MKPQFSAFFQRFVLFLLFFGGITTSTSLQAQVSGRIYQDYNANGTFDSTATYQERGLANVLVKVFNTAGTQVGTTQTTTTNGFYNVTGVTGAVRVEFTLPTGYYPSKGSTGASTVQFKTAPATNVNLATNVPGDYVGGNPSVATSMFIVGDNVNGVNKDLTLFFKAPYNGSTTQNGGPGSQLVTNTPVANNLATAKQIGAVYGVGYQKKTASIFTSAFHKRHAGYGPAGTGGIYVMDSTGANTRVFADFNALLGANTTGVNTHSTDPTDLIVNDLGARDGVGKLSFGDLDVMDNDNFLLVTSLANKTLYRVKINTIAGVVQPASAADISAFPFNGTTDCAHPANVWIFGIGVKNGRVFVGGVCNAEVSLNRNDLRVYVWEVNLTNNTWTQVLSFFPNRTYAQWQAWSSTDQGGANPEPILSDVAFDGDFMVLGLRDRFGDKVPFNGNNLGADPFARGYGDIMRAAPNTGVTAWTIENNGTSGGITTTTGYCTPTMSNQPPPGNTCPLPTDPNDWSSNAAQGQGGNEYYWGDESTDGGRDGALGSLVQIPGYTDVLTTMYDPSGINCFNTGGWTRISNLTGAPTGDYTIYDATTQQANFYKANGVGDVEAVGAPAPIEVGNYIWLDTDKDGIQDAGEVGISGLTVRLFKNGSQVATTTTAADGSYYFSGLEANNNTYQIRIATNQTALSARTLTTTNAGTSDELDNDAFLNGADYMIPFTSAEAGQNNHSYDFGFKALQPDLELEKTVDNCAATFGGNVIFTVKVRNKGGAATGVQVKDTPSAGLTFVSANPSGSFTSGTGIWNIGNIAAGDSATIILTYTTTARGLLHNTAEVTAVNEGDVDATVNNAVETEDDFDRATVGVPIQMCQGESYTLMIPATFTGIQWYKDGAIISGQTGTSLVVNAAGSYTFTATQSSCPTGGCCPVVVEMTTGNNANAGSDQVKCNTNTFTMSGSGALAGQTGTWTVVSGSASITTPSSATTNVTLSGTTATLRYTLTGGGACSSFDNMIITNNMMTISASSSAITCNNNGTPTNPNDDTFTFTLNVTGTGVGTTWKALDALNYTTGTYGTPKTMGPYPISAGNVVLQIWDSNSPNCTTTSLTVTPPATCSNTCPERPCVPMTAAKN